MSKINDFAMNNKNGYNKTKQSLCEANISSQKQGKKRMLNKNTYCYVEKNTH